LMRKSAEHHVEMTIDHARRIFLRALEKLNASPTRSADLEDVVWIGGKTRRLYFVTSCDYA
jgi:hypothetical protein